MNLNGTSMKKQDDFPNSYLYNTCSDTAHLLRRELGISKGIEPYNIAIMLETLGRIYNNLGELTEI